LYLRDSAADTRTLYQVNAKAKEIIISCATVANSTEVISAITAAQLNLTASL
jgi:hypothetical protein